MADHDETLDSDMDPMAETSDGRSAIEPPAGMPERVGPYKLLGILGEGGFGVVYEAEQHEPVRRRVALKIIKPGMDSAAVIARFNAERQALALMDHPNVARVFDAGTTELGRPYFVMELVRGEPITAYADRHNLSTDERLKLMVTVCNAVQHAHSKGVIHRDIKPSNVLVTVQDGKAAPKVIDFGVAKATTAQLTAETMYTQVGQLIGTPEYMSPEQAEMSVLDVDTRADVYSLGVVLYELLTGTLPFEKERLRSVGFAEIQRIIREEEPPRPSTRLSTMGAKDQAGMSVRHRAPIAQLRSHLKGELDWIVMKAIEKDRTRRYDTADALANDVERFLAHEPVEARPPTASYRLRKLARRNRGVVTTLAVLGAAVLVTVGGLGYGLMRIRAQRDATARAGTVDRAHMIMDTMNAVRSYTTDRVRPHLADDLVDADVFPRESVPAFAAGQVFERFASGAEYGSFLYKKAALNPTNPRDLADEFEGGVIDSFRSDTGLEESSGFLETRGAERFYIARPIIVNDSSCLQCHGEPDAAPDSMKSAYGDTGGFGWRLGETIGAQFVYVPASQVRAGSVASDLIAVGLLGGLFVVLAVGSVVIVRRA